MTVELKLIPYQVVEIIQLETKGIVRAVKLDKEGITFLVTYWWEGKLQEVWLCDFEIKAVEK